MFAKRMGRVAPSAIMELIKTTAAGDYISFASGLPDPELFPVDALREIVDDVLTRDGPGALQYGAAEGYAPLRDYVAGVLRGRGLSGSAENVLITSGSQQALDLAARALLDPGDPVAIESPSYLAAIQVFDSCDAAYRMLPMDGDGMCLDGLNQALHAGVKVAYTLPNFQNPTGISMTCERRAAAAEAAAEAGVALIEDDAYHDLRYDGPELPPVSALAHNPWAIYTGTFSKTIAPGVRVGYVWAEPGLIARLAQLKQITDLHSGSLTQRVVYEYCARGQLEAGIARLRQAYGRRRDVMLEALDEHLSPYGTWTRPRGGMFIWVTLSGSRDAGAVLDRAMARGVLFVPGAGFYPAGSALASPNTLRLNFVSAGEEQIRTGIALLASAVREGES